MKTMFETIIITTKTIRMVSIITYILFAYFPFMIICGNTEEERPSTTPEIDLELRLSPYQQSTATQSSSLNTGEQKSHTANTDQHTTQLLIRKTQHRHLTDEQRRDGIGKPSKKILNDRFKMRQQREEIIKAGGETLQEHRSKKAAYMRTYREKQQNDPSKRQKYQDQACEQNKKYQKELKKRPEAYERRKALKRISERKRKQRIRLQKQQLKQEQQREGQQKS